METPGYIAPSVFVNHGGGPNPVLGEKHNLEIAQSLRDIGTNLDLTRLKAIILVTAHWEEDVVTISSSDKHELLFDYYNFPPESYTYKYNGRGDPVLAGRIHEALSEAQIKTKLDGERGWDHGVFIPMMLIRPEADIPIVQVSIMKNQNPNLHYKIGNVLYEFRKEGIAVLGSGLSYHNMQRFKSTRNMIDGVVENAEFDKVLTEVCTGDERERQRIVEWEHFPGAFDCHPKGEADHLMPLIVAAGAGGKSIGRKVFGSAFKTKFLLSSFIWD